MDFKNVMESNWKEVKGKVKENWGKLQDDDVERIDGKLDQLEAHLQKQYGYSKEKADEEINKFFYKQNIS